jgi:hypothetical protein
MDAQEMLNKLKRLVFEEQPGNPAAPSGTTVKTKDGQELSVDKMEAGGVALQNGQPAPAGEYELEDGTVLVLAEGGVIAEVKAANPNPAPEMNVNPAPAPSNYDAQFSEINQKFESYEQKFAAYEQRFAGAEATITKQQEAIGSLVTLVEQLAKTPVANPPADPHKFSKAEPREDRIEATASAFAELKKNLNK